MEDRERGLRSGRHFFGVLPPQLRHLGGNHELAVGVSGVACEEVLVIGVGGKEGGEGLHLGDDGRTPVAARIEFADEGLCGGVLGGGVVEDHGAVLGADVGALTVHSRGVMGRKEDGEEVAVGEAGGVKGDVDDFRVASGSRGHLLVGRPRQPPARVASLHRHHAPQGCEDRFHAPEAAASQRRDVPSSGGRFGGVVSHVESSGGEVERPFRSFDSDTRGTQGNPRESRGWRPGYGRGGPHRSQRPEQGRLQNGRFSRYAPGMGLPPMILGGNGETK
jgi:hypothetical protein